MVKHRVTRPEWKVNSNHQTTLTRPHLHVTLQQRGFAIERTSSKLQTMGLEERIHFRYEPRIQCDEKQLPGSSVQVYGSSSTRIVRVKGNSRRQKKTCKTQRVSSLVIEPVKNMGIRPQHVKCRHRGCTAKPQMYVQWSHVVEDTLEPQQQTRASRKVLETGIWPKDIYFRVDVPVGSRVGPIEIQCCAQCPEHASHVIGTGFISSVHEASQASKEMWEYVKLYAPAETTGLTKHKSETQQQTLSRRLQAASANKALGKIQFHVKYTAVKDHKNNNVLPKLVEPSKDNLESTETTPSCVSPKIPKSPLAGLVKPNVLTGQRTQLKKTPTTPTIVKQMMSTPSTIQNPEDSQALQALLSKTRPHDISFTDLTIVSQIGQGLFANVKLAEWTTEGEHKQHVALKEFNYNPSKAPSLRTCETFEDEYNMLRRLDHPHILRILSAYTRPRLSLVTEYCSGGSLYDTLQTSLSSVKDKLSLCRDVASALEYLHAKSIVHRDIKSHNILLSEDRTSSNTFVAKLGDFGAAIQLESPDVRIVDTESHGTSGYTAPEILQLQVSSIGGYAMPSDIWSLGIVMWEIMTPESQNPFTGVEPQVVLDHVHAGARPEVASTCPIVSLLHRCWASNPDDRPMAHQVVAELNEVVSSMSIEGL